ncbi:hypothetical protein [Peribacillus simplex]|uniref:hypothetical protein n=1 Tax=Peribacillus simplex TaxID=1478 RepID=UPI0028530DAB|nr:hypothetical protein [Peribacillus simplex]MDR4927236.1 hypothetical protein [Peribacillus simplex]
METFVLYIYRSIKNNVIDDKSYLSFGEHLPLIAIVQNELEQNNRIQKVREYKLQPFEINQKNYNKALLNSEILSFKVLDIEFNDYVDEEEKTELIHLLRKNDWKTAANILKDIREEMEIESLSFLHKGRHFKISKYGVIEVDAEIYELEELTTKTPVAYITGLIPWGTQTEAFNEF